MEKLIDIRLDFRSKRSISDQLQEEMRRLIVEGALPPGGRLPTVRSLAAQLQVNFNTVARVYRLLDEEGLISTQQGRGSYILSDQEEAPKELASQEDPVDWLVRELLEKAARLHISSEDVRSALLRRVPGGERKKRHSPRKRLSSQKKRLVTPLWISEASHPKTASSIRKAFRSRSRQR